MNEPLRVIIDNNVFDLFFEMNKAGENLNVHFPPEEFVIEIPPEVQIENEALQPSDGDRAEKKAFFLSFMKERNVKIDRMFGFNDPDSPSIYAPFDEGRWGEASELEVLQSAKLGKLNQKTRLQKHQGDASLAARSTIGIVLTRERMDNPKKKNHPLQVAHRKGDLVISLNAFDWQDTLLSTFIRAQLASRSPRRDRGRENE